MLCSRTELSHFPVEKSSHQSYLSVVFLGLCSGVFCPIYISEWNIEGVTVLAAISAVIERLSNIRTDLETLRDALKKNY